MHRYRSEIIICLLLVTGLFGVFRQVHNHDFVNYDDKAYITENNYVRAGWSKEGLIWAFTTRHHSHWHPVTWLSHMTDCQLFGLNPGRHHLISLLLHIINTLLLFFIFNRMTNAPFRSGMVAALFAFHPLHVESVAWVADRKDVLSTFIWMLSMGAYVRYSEHPGTGRYLAVWLLFMLALMSKPMVVTFPLVLILLDYWPLGRLHFKKANADVSSSPGIPLNIAPTASSPKRILVEKFLLLLPVIASVVITIVLMNLGRSRPFHLSQLLPTISRIKESLGYYAVYIKKMLYPVDLAVPYPALEPMQDWQIAGAFVLLTGITLLAFLKRRKYPYIAVGWLWYLITLSPVVGLVPVGPRLIADRYTYLPLIGLFIIFAWGVPDLLTRLRRKRTVSAIGGGLLLSGLMILSWLQAGHWKDSITLFTHTINVTNGNYITQNNLGQALLDQGRIEEAIFHFTESLKIKPDYAITHLNLGAALQEQGKLEEACIQYHEVLRFEPYNAWAHYNLGIVFAQQKKYKAALDQYSKAVQLKPDYAQAHNNLGAMLAKLGRLEKAVHHFSEAVRINPGHFNARRNLNHALRLLGRPPWETEQAP